MALATKSSDRLHPISIGGDGGLCVSHGNGAWMNALLMLGM